MGKLVNILIRPQEGDPIELDLNLRYLLADTIQSRNLGRIVNEGSGEDYIEVSFTSAYGQREKSGIESLIASLGLSEMTKIEVGEID